MEWFQLLIATVLAIAFLIIPGFLLSRSFGMEAEFSLGMAPIVTIACYGVLSVVYGILGIPCGWLTLFLPLVILGAICMRLRGGSHEIKIGFSHELMMPFQVDGVLGKISPMRLGILLAVAAGIATSLAVYVCNIGSPNEFIQNYDNAFHLSQIDRFVETSNYSPLSVGFYPSAWHGIGAMVVSMLGISSMMAEHATNLAFIISVFSIGSVLLLSVLFPKCRRLVWLGGMLCLSFGFFPWRIMLFGPLYPNLASLCIMPVVAALFILLCGRRLAMPLRVRYGVLFVIGGIAMVFAQPNAIFSTGAFLIPFCVWRLFDFARDKLANRNGGTLIAVTLAALLVLAFATLWFALSQMPFMHSVVYYPREATLDFGQAVRWALGFSFVIKRQQYLAAIVVAIGALVLLARPKTRWIPFSYAFLLMLFVVAISMNGPLKYILVGFWYSDCYRLAATVCVFAVPLIATGMDAIVSGIQYAIGKLAGNRIATRSVAVFGGCASAIVVAAIMAINYIPFQFIEHYYRSFAFDAVSYEMRDMYQNSENDSLDSDELAFLDEVSEIVPEDEPVFNIPFDGSVFAQSTSGVRVVYNAFGAEPNPNTKELRENLCNIAADETVREAAKSEDIQYVLQLDQGSSKDGFSEDGTVYTLGYAPEDWTGVTGLNDETPGFECVLAEDDMRLYKIAVS